MFNPGFGLEALPWDKISPVLLFILVAWEFVWKGIGLWYAARNSQKVWFGAILIFNTLGILPLIYLKFFPKKDK